MKTYATIIVQYQMTKKYLLSTVYNMCNVYNIFIKETNIYIIKKNIHHLLLYEEKVNAENCINRVLTFVNDIILFVITLQIQYHIKTLNYYNINRYNNEIFKNKVIIITIV